MSDKLQYSAIANFEAAHFLPSLPESHPSGRMHGHSFLAKMSTALPEGWTSFPGAEVDALRIQLIQALSPLDHNLLNREIEDPSNENIACWINSRLEVSGVDTIGVQIGQQEGADLDKAGHAHLWRRHRFESAHQLPNVPLGHKCGRMHGHGFEVILHADIGNGSTPRSLTYDQMDSLWTPLFNELDHACLNDIPGLQNPTSEVMSNWLWNRLKPIFPELTWVTVYETASCGAHFDGANYRIWKEMTFDSAVKLNRVPEGDVRRRIHGHTYTLRLHLQTPLDQIMGWTVDFGDVKLLFDPIFKRLDHNPLYEIAGIKDADTGSLVRWIREQTSSLLPELDRIDLFETLGCGVVLNWGNGGPVLPV